MGHWPQVRVQTLHISIYSIFEAQIIWNNLGDLQSGATEYRIRKNKGKRLNYLQVNLSIRFSSSICCNFFVSNDCFHWISKFSAFSARLKLLSVFIKAIKFTFIRHLSPKCKQQIQFQINYRHCCILILDKHHVSLANKPTSSCQFPCLTVRESPFSVLFRLYRNCKQVMYVHVNNRKIKWNSAIVFLLIDC